MKIPQRIARLHLLDKVAQVMIGRAESTTHDIERLPGEGYLVTKKANAREVYLVPFTVAICEFVKEEDDARATPAARRPPPGRGNAKGDPAEVPGS